VVNKFFKATSEFPKIAESSKKTTQQTNIDGSWHSDHSYDEIPAMGSILVARTLSETGGDTQFANLAAAYDALSSVVKERIANLRAMYSKEHIYGENSVYRHTDLAEQLAGMNRIGDATHPVVITHPKSGRKVLFANLGHTIQFEDWEFIESYTLLDKLYAHVNQPPFTCSFNWLPGSVTFWDNRCIWNNDYQDQARLMHRITLEESALTAD
jgi:taurine dioxygenase